MAFHCLLVSVNTTTTPYVVHPLGIAHLAGALKLQGCDVRQYDVLARGGLDGIAGIVSEFAPQLIGVSIRNIDTVDSADPRFFIEGAREIIQRIRAQSDAPIVAGGAGFSLFPERLITHLGVDYGIVGEGEEAICRLAHTLENGQRPPQRLLTGAAQSNARWRPVAYDRAVTDFYVRNGGMLNVQTKRGCPFRCAYCSYPLLEGPTFRFRDPDEVAEEFLRIRKDYGGRYVFLTDSVFNDRKGHHLAVAEALVRHGNTLPWCAYFQPSRLERGAMELLRRAGLQAMEFGTDASSDTTLRGMQKPFRFRDVLAAQCLADEFEIPTAHFVIFGGPDEDEHTFAEGLENIRALGRTVVMGFSGIRILPDAPIHQRAIRDGLIAADTDLLPPTFYFSPKIDRTRMERRLTEEWSSDATRVFPVSDTLDSAAQLHKFGVVGPLWDKLL